MDTSVFNALGLRKPKLIKIPYFTDYKTHLGFRGKYKKNLEAKKCGKIFNNISNIIFHQCKCKLHSACKMHPHFPPTFVGESASYSLKNTVHTGNKCFLLPDFVLSVSNKQLLCFYCKFSIVRE